MLSGEINKILIGSLLGDACMEKNGRYFRVKFEHSMKERKYLLWKYHSLKEIAASFPYHLKRKDTRTQREYVCVRFATKSIPQLKDYYYLYYPEGKKRVPSNIKKIFKSTLSLAVWYMDDGHRRKDCKALRINTQGFRKEEVEFLREVLKENFDIESNLHRVVRKQFVIYIGGDDAKKFCNLIHKHILPSMEYKLL
jgi:hypothetical protein